MPKLNIPNLDSILQRYVNGESELSLARQIGVDRGVIRRRLISAGIRPRNISEANIFSMSQMSSEERKARAAMANSKVKGMKRSDEDCIRRAIARQKTLQYISATEIIIRRWFEQRHIKCVPQLAVFRYNLDIAIESPPIDVEVKYCSTSHVSLNKRIHGRTKYLLNHGWHVAFIMIDPNHPLLEIVADNIADWAYGLNQTPYPQYKVFNGNGD